MRSRSAGMWWGTAIELRASVAADQPNDKVRVLIDPAGHPFCLCLDE